MRKSQKPGNDAVGEVDRDAPAVEGAAPNAAARRHSTSTGTASGKFDPRSPNEAGESEIVIPFRTLRYRPGPDQVWGLNIQRNLRRRNELSFWAPVSRAFRFTQIELAGELYDFEARAHRNLKLLPYVLGGFSQNYELSGDQNEVQREVGLDVKYSVTPGLTLDLTVNTDFAQVEVDDEQINLTRFDLFFPEKRPFFLENSGFFEFGSGQEVEIFFSRRIGLDENRQQVPIDAGARLKRKGGSLSDRLAQHANRQRGRLGFG